MPSHIKLTGQDICMYYTPQFLCPDLTNGRWGGGAKLIVFGVDHVGLASP